MALGGMTLAAGYRRGLKRKQEPEVPSARVAPPLWGGLGGRGAQPPVFPEAAPLPPPPAAAPPEPAPEAAAMPGTDYSDIIDAAVAEHQRKRPGMPLTSGEVSEVAKQVGQRLRGGAQAKLFLQTGLTTRDMTARDMVRALAASQQKEAGVQADLAQLDEKRFAQGLPPMAEMDPRVRESVTGLAQIAAIQRRKKAKEEEIKARIYRREKLGIKPENGWLQEDLDAWDQGLKTEVSQMRLAPPPTAAQFQEAEFGGQKFIKAPKGFEPVKPKEEKLTPEEQKRLQAATAQLGVISRARLDAGEEVARKRAKVKVLRKLLKEQEAILSGGPPEEGDRIASKAYMAAGERVSELKEEIATETEEMGALVSRDARLSAHEATLRAEVGGGEGMAPEYITGEGGTREAVEIPEEIEEFITDEPLEDVDTAVAYVVKLHGMGVSKKDIQKLLMQHAEMPEELIEKILSGMKEQGLE